MSKESQNKNIDTRQKTQSHFWIIKKYCCTMTSCYLTAMAVVVGVVMCALLNPKFTFHFICYSKSFVNCAQPKNTQNHNSECFHFRSIKTEEKSHIISFWFGVVCSFLCLLWMHSVSLRFIRANIQNGKKNVWSATCFTSARPKIITVIYSSCNDSNEMFLYQWQWLLNTKTSIQLRLIYSRIECCIMMRMRFIRFLYHSFGWKAYSFE